MDLRENFGIFFSVVIYPVVPKDVTAEHTIADVKETPMAFSAVKSKLDGGFYREERLIAVTK